VVIVQFSNTLAEEVAGIARAIARLIADHGRRPEDILVLAQRRAIGNPIHHQLVAAGVPSKCYYHEGDLDSITAQERMALFKLFIDPEDRIALRWLLGFGSDDFRAGAYRRLRAQCEQTGVTPWELMCQLDAGTVRIPNTNHLVARFREIRAELATLQGDGNMLNLARRWLPDDLPGIDSFRTLVGELAESAVTPQELLSNLIETISTPEIPPDVTQVRIMSLHKSKGLSSPVVVIAGCIEGLLPAAPDEDKTPEEQQADLEEQRRLLYVGLTRVKANPNTNQPGTLLLTYSRMMTRADAMYSGIRSARFSYNDAFVNASRFIRELGPAAPRPISG
jgi:DNA helicase II / ATP-dependent DNA helicase PcrA